MVGPTGRAQGQGLSGFTVRQTALPTERIIGFPSSLRAGGIKYREDPGRELQNGGSSLNFTYAHKLPNEIHFTSE